MHRKAAGRIACFASLGLVLGFSLAGCMGIETTNNHLASIDRNFEADQQYLKSLTEEMARMQKHMEVMEQELVNDRQYIQTMTLAMASLAESAAAIRAMGDQMMAILNGLKTQTPDPKTPDLDDYFPAQPAPEASPEPAPAQPKA
jgi:hypothetical protein